MQEKPEKKIIFKSPWHAITFVPELLEQYTGHDGGTYKLVITEGTLTVKHKTALMKGDKVLLDIKQCDIDKGFNSKQWDQIGEKIFNHRREIICVKKHHIH